VADHPLEASVFMAVRVNQPIPITAFVPTSDFRPPPTITDFVPQLTILPEVRPQREETPSELDRLRNVEMVESPLAFIHVGQQQAEQPLLGTCPITPLPNALAGSSETPESPRKLDQDKKEETVEPVTPVREPGAKTIVLQLLARRKDDAS
jgi:hypothetical protein